MSTSELVSSILSGVAVAISVVALLWQVVRSRWERPVVVVRGEIRAMYPIDDIESGIERYDLIVSVFNVGEKPATIIEWGWLLEFEEGEPTQEHDHIGPRRIEPHDHFSTEYSQPVGLTWPDDLVIPFARVVRRPRWRRLNRDGSTVQEVRGEPISISEISGRWSPEVDPDI
jgi:hypothetical protein